MNFKVGDILYCKKYNHWDGTDYCYVGQVFKIINLISEDRCGLRCIGFKDKEDNTYNTVSYWVINDDEDVISRFKVSGLEYIWDYFETKTERAKRVIEEYENR